MRQGERFYLPIPRQLTSGVYFDIASRMLNGSGDDLPSADAFVAQGLSLPPIAHRNGSLPQQLSNLTRWPACVSPEIDNRPPDLYVAHDLAGVPLLDVIDSFQQHVQPRTYPNDESSLPQHAPIKPTTHITRASEFIDVLKARSDNPIHACIVDATGASSAVVHDAADQLRYQGVHDVSVLRGQYYTSVQPSDVDEKTMRLRNPDHLNFMQVIGEICSRKYEQ